MAEESATRTDAVAANGDGPPEGLEWHRVLAEDELPDGRVTTVTAGLNSVAMVEIISDAELV